MEGLPPSLTPENVPGDYPGIKDEANLKNYDRIPLITKKSPLEYLQEQLQGRNPKVDFRHCKEPKVTFMHQDLIEPYDADGAQMCKARIRFAVAVEGGEPVIWDQDLFTNVEYKDGDAESLQKAILAIKIYRQDQFKTPIRQAIATTGTIRSELVKQTAIEVMFHGSGTDMSCARSDETEETALRWGTAKTQFAIVDVTKSMKTAAQAQKISDKVKKRKDKS